MPDEREIGQSLPAPFIDRAVVAMICLASMLIIAVVLLAREGASRREFMSMCIENHSEERCRLLDFYDRRDLGH